MSMNSIGMLPRGAARRLAPYVRSFILPQSRFKTTRLLTKLLQRSINTSTPQPTRTLTLTPSEKKLIFPQRLVVWHAGVTRSYVLGCLRVTTILVFAFFVVVVAPTHFFAEDQPKWIAYAVLLSGAVPMLFYGYIASPFVAHIHLRLPKFARSSRALLKRYTQTLPPDAQIEITTMTPIGIPRITLMKVSDLHPVSQRFGMVNYVRDTTALNKERPWWMGKAIRQFGVHGGDILKDSQGAWNDIQRAIMKMEKKNI